MDRRTEVVIAGYGYVGRAYESLLKKVNPRICDPKLNTVPLNHNDFDAVIICVNTPTVDGQCDISNVIDVIKQTPPDKHILLKSTVTIEGWNTVFAMFPDHKITFSPEFLRAKTAMQDVHNNKKIWLSKHGDCVWWANFFKENIFPNDITVQYIPVRELILAKQMRNAFLAVKVSYFNQIKDLCDSMDMDFDAVRSCVIDDDRIGESHTIVEKGRGFGGHCLPKDCDALISAHPGQTIIESAVKYNKQFKRTTHKHDH